MIARDIAILISGARYRLGHEKLLQDDVEAMFRRAAIPFTREHILGPADRVDFLVDGRIAVELKINAAKRQIFRQMERYAMHDCVEELVLASACAVGLPPRINGKPVFVVSLGTTGL